MSEIIRLDDAREAREPHIQGPALCLACKHTWQAVVHAKADMGALECPACGAERGTFATHISAPEAGPVWTCACGTYLFVITPKGVHCPSCGSWQFGAKLAPAP